MKISFDTVVNVALLIAATTVTVAVVRSRTDQAATPGVREETVEVAGWERIASEGVQFGDPDAKVTLTVFSDFECPFCRAFHRTLQRARRDSGAALNVRVVFVHYPLSYHRFARKAAAASECAADQQRFESMADVLFEKQDSLGLIDWHRFATDAGLPSPSRFATCMASSGERPRVTRGLVLADSLGISGTPTVLVNQWRLGSPPSPERLASIVEAVAAGHAPPDGGRP